MINLGTFIILAVIVFHIIKGKNSRNIFINMFVITIFFELMIERGYFIQISNQQIAYRTLCEAITFILSLYILFFKRVKVKTKLINICIIFLLVLVVGWILLVIFPSNAKGGTIDVTWDAILIEKKGLQPIRFTNGMIIEILQILMFICITLCAYTLLTKEEWLRILVRITKMSRIMMIFFSFEAITKYIFRSSIFNYLSDLVLGKSISTYSDLNSRGNGFMLTGFTKEGSHYIFSLTVIFILLFGEYIYLNRNNGKRKFILYCAIIGMLFLLSMSFSALYYFICIVLFVFSIKTLNKCKNYMRFWVYISLGFIAFAGIIELLPIIANKLSMTSFIGRRLNSVVEEISNISNGTWLTEKNALEWSNRVRIGSTYETMKLIVYRPLIGLGFASTSAHSSLAMMVSGVGIIGLFIYYKFILYLHKKMIQKNNNILTMCIIIFLLINLFNSLGLRPFYEVWVLLVYFVFGLLSEDGVSIVAMNDHKQILKPYSIRLKKDTLVK